MRPWRASSSETDGIIASLPAGAIHVSSSTISVALSERLAEAHAKAGQRFVAAPVFGRPDVAAAGQLFVIAAGEPAAVEAAAPLFEAIGQKTFVVSDTPKTANLIKLSGNFLIARSSNPSARPWHWSAKPASIRRQYLEILTSTLFGAPVYKTYGGLIAERHVSSRPASPHPSATRTFVWPSQPPKICACPCRSPACCATGS